MRTQILMRASSVLDEAIGAGTKVQQTCTLLVPYNADTTSPFYPYSQLSSGSEFKVKHINGDIGFKPGKSYMVTIEEVAG